MSETVLLPEMLEAGVEALVESRIRNLSDLNTCVAVFLAMRAIEQIAVMQDNGSIH